MDLSVKKIGDGTLSRRTRNALDYWLNSCNTGSITLRNFEELNVLAGKRGDSRWLQPLGMESSLIDTRLNLALYL